MSTYAIGDVQGSYDTLQKLLTLCEFDPKSDQLWFTGDLVNRGPQSLEVLHYVKSLGDKAITVLGNHDLHLLAVAYGKESLNSVDTFQDILDSPDCKELCDWLRHSPLLHYDPHSSYLLVHAGLPPQWDLDLALQCAQEVEQTLQGEDYLEFFSHMYGNDPHTWEENLPRWERLRFITNCLTRIRLCNKEGKINLKHKGKPPSQSSEDIPWFKVPNRKNESLHIIFGHWAALEGNADHPNVFAIDTGCVWGGSLTAMRLEDRALFSVECKS